MSSRPGIKAALPALLLGTVLTGCADFYVDRRASDLYWDRRESIAAHAGDAVATNRATHTIDPWSPASGNRQIAFNGERMQAAAERYRTGCVYPPTNATSSSIVDSMGQQQARRPEHCSSISSAVPNIPAPPANKPSP